MGKACSKISTLAGDTASTPRKSTTTPTTTAQNGTSGNPGENTAPEAAAMASGALKADEGVEAVQVVTVEERIEPVELVADGSARDASNVHEVIAPEGETETLKKPEEGEGKTSVKIVNGQQGMAPVAVIRGEKVSVEEGETGEAKMHVSISEAIITADLPGLPATVEGVSPEDLELLRKGHQQLKEQREQAAGPVVVDKTDGETQATCALLSHPGGDNAQGSQTLTVRQDVTKAAAHGYLLYSSKKDGGSLFFVWSTEPLDSQPADAGKDQVVLLSFVPAPHKSVPKIKFTTQQGKNVLLTEIETKWEVWKKSDKKKYYAAWTQAFKICDDYEGTVTLRQTSTQWPPPVRVALLHVGPTGIYSVVLRPNSPTSLNTFSHLAVIPADAEKSLNGGNISTEKKFLDTANQAGFGDKLLAHMVLYPPVSGPIIPISAGCLRLPDVGGASLRLVRRGYGAALDQDDLIKWLKEDGIEIPTDQKGITLGGEHTQYERRAVDGKLK